MNPPTQDEINAAIEWCHDAIDEGNSHYHGMTYEEGVLAAIDWMQGHAENPTNE